MDKTDSMLQHYSHSLYKDHKKSTI